MNLKTQLHQFKFKVKFKNVQLRNHTHQRKCELPNHLKKIPQNKLPKTLREDEKNELALLGIEVLTIWTDEIVQIVRGQENFNKNCCCECHLQENNKKAQFHSQNCLDICATSNEAYIQYLMKYVHPIYYC